MADKLTKCTVCNGRGYFRCRCWPNPCDCGRDEETCHDCYGTGDQRIRGLNDRDVEVLNELEAACRNHAEVNYLGGWARPLDCGGSNGSDHSYRLSKLAKAGAAEEKHRSSWGTRGAKVYRISHAGQLMLTARKTSGGDHG